MAGKMHVGGATPFGSKGTKIKKSKVKAPENAKPAPGVTAKKLSKAQAFQARIAVAKAKNA